jgi:hypothetical protein
VRTCVACGIVGTANNPVVPFGLRHAVARRGPDGTWRSVAVSAGSIALCRECWGRYAKPNMRPKKEEPRAAD